MRDKARDIGRRGKKGFVYVITSEKFIRSLMYGAAIPVVGKGVETLVIFVNSQTPYSFPHSPLVWVVMVMVFIIAYWADENTDEWREKVEDVTGEDTADDGE